MALAQYHGGGAASHGLSVAQGGQSQARQAAARDGRALRQDAKKAQHARSSGRVKRLRVDGKATVNIGKFARGGLTRGDHQAQDHAMGCKEQDSPCGMVEEDSG